MVRAGRRRARYDYAYGRTAWFERWASEHRAVRERVGLFDLSSFGKFLVQGRDAEAVLQRICANDVAVAPGRIVYTPWLNERGGIEADLTVTRLAADAYLVVTSAASQNRDLHWLKRHIPEAAHAFVTDVTSGYAVLALMGPESRAVLGELTPTDLANDAFPFGTAQEIELGYALVRAQRISYVGELGFELYIPTEFALPVFDVIAEAAGDRLAFARFHALDSLRLEKAYRHWGHDIGDEDTPLDAGLGFACAFDKAVPFIGRDALLAMKAGADQTAGAVQAAGPEPCCSATSRSSWTGDGSAASPRAPMATRSAPRSAWAGCATRTGSRPNSWARRGSRSRSAASAIRPKPACTPSTIQGRRAWM